MFIAPNISVDSFVSLLHAISNVKPNKATGIKKSSRNSVRDTFTRWVVKLRQTYDPLPEGTGAVLFRLLFPEEDVQRKYDLQETRLAKALADVLCMQGDRGQQCLRDWNIGDNSTGCLGREVEDVVETFSSVSNFI
jgi:DNA ligase 4